MSKRKQVLEQRITPAVLSEVSRGHSKPATSCFLIKQVKAEVSQKDEGLNVRNGEAIRKFMIQATTTETHQRTTCVRIGRKLKVKHRRS